MYLINSVSMIKYYQEISMQKHFQTENAQEILHNTSNNNGISAVHFKASKNLIFKSTMFPHQKIHKHT